MIRNNKVIIALLMSPLFMHLPAYAAKSVEECQKLSGAQDNAQSRCLDSVISFVDRELQTWVNLHTFNLEEKALVNGRYSALKMFKRSQSNFITYRENDCRWQYLAISPQTGADLAYKTCYVNLSQSRIMALSKINTTNSSQ